LNLVNIPRRKINEIIYSEIGGYPMNTLIFAATAIIGVFGICVVVWSILETRKKYFNEYVARKRK